MFFYVFPLPWVCQAWRSAAGVCALQLGAGGGWQGEAGGSLDNEGEGGGEWTSPTCMREDTGGDLLLH